MPVTELDAFGQRGRAAIDRQFDPTTLCNAVSDAIEDVISDRNPT